MKLQLPKQAAMKRPRSGNPQDSLTPRQREILDFIRNSLEVLGAPPTRLDICNAFGFAGMTRVLIVPVVKRFPTPLSLPSIPSNNRGGRYYCAQSVLLAESKASQSSGGWPDLSIFWKTM